MMYILNKQKRIRLLFILYFFLFSFQHLNVYLFAFHDLTYHDIEKNVKKLHSKFASIKPANELLSIPIAVQV